MRGKSISTDETTGTTRTQPEDEPCSYHRMLECVRSQYERMSVPRKKVAPVEKEVPMAQATWADARPMSEKLKDASDLARALELNRRGYIVAGTILGN
jgi:hypothetical protein